MCGGLEDEDGMVLCDRCESPFHAECGGDGGRNPVHRGPWYCTPCRGSIVLGGKPDVVQDLGLIDYLWLGKRPEVEAEDARVRHLAANFRAEPVHGRELQTRVNTFGSPLLARWVNVPPIPMRATIARDYHEVLAHAQGQRLADTIMTHWWWPGIRVTAE